jgi:hypothetical protein
MKAMVDILTSPRSTRAARATHTHDRSDQAQTASNQAQRASNQAQTASQIRTEYWARRIIWFLISLTSLWDIAVTFDKHFALTRRFF